MHEKRDRENGGGTDALASLLEEMRTEIRGGKEVNVALLTLATALMQKANEDPASQMDQQSARYRQRIIDRQTHDEEIVPGCTSPETDAIFTAVVSKGVIQTFRDYQYPDWAMKHQSEGGRVPSDYSIDGTNKHAEPNAYLQWRWEETYQKDLRRLIGRPLPASARPKTEASAATV